MTINLAMSFNTRYLRYAYVMLTSLLKNKADDTVIRLFVLHSGLSFEDQLLIRDLLKGYGSFVEFIFINDDFFPPEMPTTEDWSLEIYYRLLIPELLPEDLDRVLYIDSDVIINHPLDELYSTPFDGNLICACENFGDLNFGEYRKRIFEGHLEKELPYVASGLLLMNLEELRPLAPFGLYLETAEKFDYHLEMPDMDLLNYVHAGQIKVLDKYKYQIFAMQSYNEGIRYNKAKECVIIHYAGHKPWQGGGIHFELEKIWWDYAKLTPFFGEFLEMFVAECVSDSFVYNKVQQLTEEKYLIQKELNMRKELCDRLLEMVENGKAN